MTALLDNEDIVKSSKNFKIPSETTLQHSFFDRKRQIYQSVYIYFFEIPSMSEDVLVRAWVNDIVNCHKCQLRG